MLLILLLGCAGPKENDTASTTGDKIDGTDGFTSTAGSGMIKPTSTTDPGGTSVGAASGDMELSGSSGGSTGGGECLIEMPDPGSCNKLVVGGGGRPGGLLGPASDLELFGTTGGDGFLEPFDVGGGGCDLFAQDCPEGQKCNAFATDGGSIFNATGCFPVAPNPDPIGASCTAEGESSGIDSCVKGAMCWGIDPQTGEGTCVELCTCSIEQPICTTPNTTCVIANDAAIVLCMPVCDPLDAGSCESDEVCISNPTDSRFFICALDASGGAGHVGDTCEFINGCAPMHTCVNFDLVPGCDPNAAGCCTPFCDLNGANCPLGMECVPWFEQGEAPKCFENLGVCAK